MKKHNHSRPVSLHVVAGAAIAAVALISGAPARADDLAETLEIRWSTLDATDLKAKADELQTPVRIFEFVRNEMEYAVYHGARSNSANTFLGRHGNDVDLASVLVAMLRSQGFPARYATGTVDMDAAGALNWLGVQDPAVAVEVLLTVGIQNVALSADETRLALDRVWVEALVPYDNYRGAGADLAQVNCATEPTKCRWLALDPSFKRLAYNEDALDLYGEPALAFDYQGYYAGDYLDSGPLEIYEDQILSYLKSDHPGKTLSDVSYTGEIVPVELSVLPASLPYRVVTAAGAFDSVVLHDEAKSPNWRKMLVLEAVAPGAGAGGSDLVIVDPVEFPLAQLSTTSLMLGFAQCAGCVEVQLRLDGAVVGDPPEFPQLAFYDDFRMHLMLDTFPVDPILQGQDGVRCYDDPGGVTECEYTAQGTYRGLQVGGLFVVASGGQGSNWAQFHGAAAKLLEAHNEFPIVYSASTPYVDEDASGDYSPGDTPLLDHPDANVALTGGLLYTAARLYAAQHRDMARRLGALNHVAGPALSLIGVVGSRYAVDFLDGTAFEVHPGGLFIDLVGIKVISQRIDDVDALANKHFELFGHAGSALEHEIWQQLTGFDAVSTVRGIQLALADGATLIDVRSDDNSFQDAAPDLKVGFGAPPDPPWLAEVFEIYDSRTWAFKASGYNPGEFYSWRRADDTAPLHYYWYSLGFANDYDLVWEEEYWYNYAVDEEAADPGQPADISTCYFEGQGFVEIPPGTLTWTEFLAQDEQCFHDKIQYAAAYATFRVWDENDVAGTGSPYDPGEQTFVDVSYEDWRGLERAVFLRALEIEFSRADDLGLLDQAVFPTKFVEQMGDPLQVYIWKRYDQADPQTGERRLTGASFVIANQSQAAGGGHVSANQTDLRDPPSDAEGEYFENSEFTDKHTTSETNNGVCTGTTDDPVSTITGNMFHDETDFVIPGRSIDLVFTRTYNSASTHTASEPLGPGWTHSYNMHLQANDYGSSPNASGSLIPANENGRTSSITYVNERGGAVNFPVDDLGDPPSWAVTSPAGNFDVLTLDDPDPGKATLSFVNGVKYIFEGGNLRFPGAGARLAEIKSPEGDSLTFEYVGGKLARGTEGAAAEAAGRTGLVFDNPGAQLDSVTDWEGRQWSFSYSGSPVEAGYSEAQEVTAAAHLLLEVATADMDGDGDLDVVVVRFDMTTFQGYVEWYENAGGEAWIQRGGLGSGSPMTATPADLDADGREDMVLAYQYGGMYWYKDLGPPIGWIEQSHIGSWKNGSSIAVADIDGDDALDVVTRVSGGHVDWHRNVGSGSSWEVNRIADGGVAPPAESILVADLNDDHVPDVATAASGEGQITWYENDHVGGWISRTIPTSSAGVSSLVSIDVDADTDEDLVAGLVSPSAVVWYENDSGTWTEHTIDSSVNGPVTVFARDVEPDGDIDLFMAAENDDTVAWYENVGGSWTRHDLATSASQACCVSAGDFDGDGDADVVFGATGDGTVALSRYQSGLAARLAHVTNALNKTTDYEYDPESGLLELIRLPQERDGAQVETSFSYYRNGRTFDNVNSYGHGERLEYDFFRKKTRVTGFRGGVQEFSYDRFGRLTKLIQPDGAVLQFGNTDDHLRDSKTDGLGYETQYSYCLDRSIGCAPSDAKGLVTLEKDPKNFTVEMDYEGPHNRISRIQDENGVERVFTYYDHTDGVTGAFDGKLETTQIKQLGPHSDVVLERFFYYDNGNLKTHVEYFDPSNPAKTRTTTYIYNDSGLNPAEIVPEEIIVAGWDGETSRRTREIDALGRITSETLYRRTSYSNATEIPLTTRYGYDDLGRVRLISDSDLNQERRFYDDNGRLTEVQRRFWLEASSDYTPWDSVLRRKYDLADRMIEARDVNDQLTTYERDEAGNVIKVTGPTGQTLRYEYDAMNRRTAVIDQNGHRLETVYDLAGRPVKLIDPTGIAVENEYDKNGRLVKVEDPQLGNQTQLDYDQEGNLTKMINANASEDASLLNSHGASEYREYDELGRVVRIVDALDKETLLTYDLLGNVTSITDAENNTTTFEYDGLGRLEAVEEPGAGALVTTHEYDEAGNRIYSKYRSGAEEVVDYDNLNRLITSTILGTGDVQIWTYDDRERLETIGNADVSYGLTYDLKNRLETRTDSRLPGQPVAYGYDAADHLTRKTDYQGDVTEFDYDGTGRLVGERNAEYLQVSYQYDGAGRVLRRILSNGARTEYAYDAGGRLAKLSNRPAGGTLLQEIEYTERDRVGNVEQMTTTHADGRVEVADFQYDRLHRLEEAVYTIDSVEVERQSFTYDAAGNRKTKTSTLAGGQTHHYFYNEKNQLTDIRLGPDPTDPLVHHFEYDDNGNMTSRSDAEGSPELVLHYDERDRVSSIDVGGAEVARYQYDPRGYRIEKDGSEGIRRSLLAAEHLEAVYDDQDNLRAKFLRGSVIDEVVNAYYYDAQGKESTYTYHHDALQSVVGLSGHAGTVEETLRYGPFGDLLEQAGSSPSALRFTGREFDAETGLYYYRARYYDPEVGRFVSEDPLGFGGGDVNLYAYVGNNPLRANDPFGLIQQHQALSGASRVFRELADFIEFEFSMGLQASLTARSGTATGEISLDFGSQRMGWSNTGWSESYTEGFSLALQQQLLFCETCTVGVEAGILQTLDYLPGVEDNARYLLNRWGTEEAYLAGQLGSWGGELGGRIATNATDFRVGGGVAALLGIEGYINVSEMGDAVSQAIDYIARSGTEALLQGQGAYSPGAGGGFVPYASQSGLSQAKAVCGKW